MVQERIETMHLPKIMPVLTHIRLKFVLYRFCSENCLLADICCAVLGDLSYFILEYVRECFYSGSGNEWREHMGNVGIHETCI
jgi:hypothetical protein